MAVGATSSADFDNFTLKELINVGHSFQVAGTGDTLDNDLATAKGSAPVDNDTFIVTGIAEELMPNIVDRDFSAASAWTNVDINAYSETADLTITADAANQYCTLPVAYAPVTAAVTYRLYFDLANIVSTWTLKDFTGTDTLGTITANGTQQYIEFTVVTGGGFRLVSTSTTSSGDFDNFSLKAETASVAYVGNLTAAYGFNASKRSTLLQTAANRTSAGYNLKGLNTKTYELKYTIIEGLAPDGDFALTLEGFGGDTEIIGLQANRELTGTPDWTNVDIGTYDEAFDITMLDSGTEIMPNSNDQDFAGASAWTNVDIDAYEAWCRGELDPTDFEGCQRWQNRTND